MTSVKQETPETDGAICLDAELLSIRANRFASLAALLGLDVSEYEEAIDVILRPCPAVHACLVNSSSVADVGASALDWVRSRHGIEKLHSEHIRLFGGQDISHQMPLIAPFGAMYEEGDSEDTDAWLLDLYDEFEFRPGITHHGPTYIVSELGFMAHLLGRAATGDMDALALARDFLVSHLFMWGVVFSAAISTGSPHPVIKFAGLSLENILFCEGEHARQPSFGYGILKDSP